ncbi:unnamed protein product [Urochloa decumbens]|uniref:Uncharacterized protein n=1 Tax=Urochloa decumbens TaxID=240449 RepID=A0ABC9B2I4_9POAL
MDLVSGALGSVIGKLGDLLQGEYKLQKGLSEEIESLKHELESAQTALRKVGEVPPEQLDPQVRLWAREVREASYDMEDILGTFLVQMAAPAEEEKKHSLLKRLQTNIADLVYKTKARHTIAGAIEDMKKRLQEKEDEDRLQQQDEDSFCGRSWGPGQDHSCQGGFDELKPRYDCGAFLSVGRKPDLAQVFKDIFILLDEEKHKVIRKVTNQQLLIGELRKFLQNRRYFIVIDDVWEVPTWKTIKSALVENDNGSRVVTTTRNRDVASSEVVYELDPLSFHNSKKLFYTRLFGVKGECPSNHPAEASDKILKKCAGVPLAIITMASLLVGKSREDWFDMCKSPGFYRGKGNQQVTDNTEWILSLSYYDLPSNLKTCLLYLSVYPEDYDIGKDSLIWKWIAEGFVEKKVGSSLFQRGEEYFNQLINRSMIQAVESEWTGIIEGCHVHDMVLDLIRGLSDKENFVTISNDAEGTSSSGKKVRRLAHQNIMMKQTQKDDHVSMAHVRSLVACRCDIESWVLQPSFKLLRLLALEGCEIEDDWQGLKHLGNLVHLRYLSLRHTYGSIGELPKEIGKLKFLQTLDLEGSEIKVLPSAICELTQLVWLRGDLHTCAPDGLFLTKVTSLEELKICFENLDKESQRQFVKNVGNLSQVRVLDICGCLEGVVQSLDNLHKLQDLQLTSSELYGGEATTREWDTVVLPPHLRHLRFTAILFSWLPSCIKPERLQHLYELSLHVDYLDEAGLRTLGRLPELHFLELRPILLMAFTATVANITAGDDFFLNLRCCDLGDCMVQLVVNEDSTSVSFSIWGGKGNMAVFGSKAEDESSRSVAPPPVMPNLQRLHFAVPVRALYKDGNGGCDNLRLECLPSLRNVEVDILCFGATDDDVEKAEAELRHAAQLHPKGPMLELKRWGKTKDEESNDGGDDLSAEEGEGELVSSSGDDEVGDVESSGGPVTPSC